ncbi:MAG: ATP-dependent Clp protease adaptor ClpS [Flavobacteriaceae bacterium]|nr:ATP-dependent Clp protease adaptor ClpS [Flavobacteriaceae bacterium]MDG2503273.1 ATP-dependent Clp protease adaptor ClpS [Flavobacteriaceae bacterium]
MSEKNPLNKPEEVFEVSTFEDREHEIILYNDDVNTFEHVIECLMAVCDHTALQAEQCAYLVHYTGKCGVKTGSLDELVPKCSALLEEGLTAEVV